MYSYQDLVDKNLPVCVRVKAPHQVQVSWGDQLSLFVLLTTACMSGITVLTYYTNQWGLHAMKPLGLELDSNLMLLVVGIFAVSVLGLGLWLPEQGHPDPYQGAQSRDALNYIFPQANSLHLGSQAWDLAEAHQIDIDFPYRVQVHFRSPTQTFILEDDHTGWPAEIPRKHQRQKLRFNSALMVYVTGIDLPNRRHLASHWGWNLFGALLFMGSTSVPFLWQGLGFPYFWISFLAIPLSYLTLKAGQKEFSLSHPFNYQRFRQKYQNYLNSQLYRAP